jgi:hypothetical protein
MKKFRNGLILAAFFTSIFCLNTQAFDKSALEQVRNKPVLDSSDYEVIDKCLSDAIQELVKADDLTEISRIRAQIRTYKESNQESAKEQYHRQFYGSAHKYIAQALEQTQTLPDSKQQFRITINLLILIYELNDAQLADLVIDKLNDKSMAIRYWATNCIADPKVIKQLNTDSSYADLSVKIVQQFDKSVSDCEPDTLSLIVDFARDSINSQAPQLLLKIADLRIKQYADWSVKNELLDAGILKALFQKTSATPPYSEAAQRFCQLFSYVIQRYLKGAESLPEETKQQLLSVMVETEERCFKKITGLPTKIRNTLEKNDKEQLLKEHNLLLGEEAKEGLLPAKYQFMYKRPDGKESNAPLSLVGAPVKSKT